MTIQVMGHVHKVENGVDSIAVHVVFDQNLIHGPGDECVIFFVPKTDASHWLVGRGVNLTAYAFDPDVSATERIRSDS